MKIKNYTIILITVFLLFFLIFVYFAYTYHWEWTGFDTFESPNALTTPYKRFWEWLDLLIVPLLLSIIAYLLDQTYRNNQASRQQLYREQETIKREHEIKLEHMRQSQQIFDKLISNISELIFEHDLIKLASASHIGLVATSWVLSSVSLMEPEWRTQTVLFLYRTKLINRDNPVIDLKGANLAGAILENVNLSLSELENANFEKANMSGAKLDKCNLNNANLFHTLLCDSSLIGCTLIKTDLRRTNLSNSFMSNAQIEDVLVDDNTILPNNEIGSININWTQFTK